MKHDECSRTSGASTDCKFAHHEGDRLVPRLVLDVIGDDPSLAVPRGQIGLGGPMDQLLAEAAVLDEGLDGDKGQSVLACDGMELFASGHVNSVGDLAEHARGSQARQPDQVHRCFGMPGAAEHATLFGNQRK